MSGDIEKKMIMRRIRETSNLPAPSAHVIKIMVLLRDENVNLKELVDNLAKDQSLVAQILKMINSGYYGLRQTIESIDQAVNLLGIINVKQVVYSATVIELFSRKEQAEWEHSYSTSVFMNRLMHQNSLNAASNLAITTLLHDIGKIVLRRYSPKKYQLAIEIAESQGIPSHEAERRFFYVDHAEVGAWLLRQWDMTEDIIAPILAHHAEGVPDSHIVETALLQFANFVDCAARGEVCARPTAELMAAAGFAEISVEEWTEPQRQLIAELDGAIKQAPALGDSTQKISRANVSPN